MLDRVEIFIGMIPINAVNLMVGWLIVKLWLSVRDRNNLVVRVQDRLRLNWRPIVWCRVMEWFRGRLIHRLNLGNIRSFIDGFWSLIYVLGSMVDGFRRMVNRFRSLINRFRSLIDGFGSMIDRFMSLMDRLMVTRSSDVVMLEPTVYTVHSVTILEERLRDVRWS